jgi:putative DNA methylase
LSNPAIAALIRDNLNQHNGTKYHLLSYCVMPNHVHILIQPIGDGLGKSHTLPMASRETVPDEIPDRLSPLARIMHSLKSYTAHEANKILNRKGQFWQHESYDHWVRDDDELERILIYIADNPVKAKLVPSPELWLYYSARDRFLRDGSMSGLLI